MRRQQKNLKTLLSVLLAIFMMYSCMSIGIVSYASAEKIYYVTDSYYNASSEAISTAETEVPLEEYLISELRKCPESVNLSAYYIKPEQMNDIGDLIFDLSPELFHISRIAYSTLFGYVVSIIPEYRYTADEYEIMYNDCLDSAQELLSGIKDNDKLSDVQKALLLHDRIAVLCEYDYKNLQQNTIPYESYTMYGVLVNETAVCQGYAETYLYLLREIGIDSYLCESSELNHAWNIVEIDGEEYHVDITWDDPVDDITGRVRHVNFLRSSEGIYESKHNADDYITTPDSTKYDDYFWQNSTAAFQLVGDELYYIDETDSYIKKYSDNSKVKSVSDMWMSGPSSYYPGCYARLSAKGTNLYYNSSQSVFEFNPETGETTKIWTPEGENEYFRIYGFRYHKNYLYCDLFSSPNFTLTTKADYQQKKFWFSGDVLLTGISINTYPDKTAYDLNESLSADGLSLLLSYNDGTSAVITEGFSVSDTDTSSEGEKTVVVTYEDFSVSYTINVACLHKNISNVPAAESTCEEQGHGAYSKCLVCKRLLSGSDELLPLKSHNYEAAVTTQPTCTEKGERTFTCSVCSDTYTEEIAKTPGHNYKAEVTAPTCTVQGYTTYTCECGDSYVSDYVVENGHSYTSEITTPATHTEKGVMTYTCFCGDTYTEEIAKTPGHSYESFIETEPGCETNGTRAFECECGDAYYDLIPATGHTDRDNNNACDNCGTGVCDHMCHKTGFTAFIWKVINFFQKLFGVSPVCECGVAHY